MGWSRTGVSWLVSPWLTAAHPWRVLRRQRGVPITSTLLEETLTEKHRLRALHLGCTSPCQGTLGTMRTKHHIAQQLCPEGLRGPRLRSKGVNKLWGFGPITFFPNNVSLKGSIKKSNPHASTEGVWRLRSRLHPRLLPQQLPRLLPRAPSTGEASGRAAHTYTPCKHSIRKSCQLPKLATISHF